MPTLDELNDDIAQSAVDPRTVSVADASATQQSIDDKIKAADRLAGREAVAANRKGLGLRIQAIRPYYP